MSMRRCPVCHEMYSDTYRNCPFCEETAALKRGKKIQRRGGRRVARGGFDPSGAIITLLLLAVLGAGVYFFFGDAIAQSFGIRESTENVNPGGTEQQGDPAQEPDTDQPTDTDPTQDPDTDQPVTPVTPDPPSPPVSPVQLAKDDVTVSDSLGLSAKLKVSGGSGTYSWSSSNSSIVTVSPEGVITGVSSGTATVTVTDGNTSAQCIVRVKKQ